MSNNASDDDIVTVFHRVKLPIPPSAPSPPPPRNLQNDQIGSNVQSNPVAAHSLTARNDEHDVPSSLDVHIRWVVESGSIVQKGEKLVQLFYAFHGSPPPPPGGGSSASKSTSIIRARAKKKRWAATTPSAETTNVTQANSDALPKENNFVLVEMRSPSNGFLRVLYKKSFAFNAVKIDHSESQKYSAINLILAAIEECEHPAVIGGLCAVCGADMRAPKESNMKLDEHVPEKHQSNSKNAVRNRPMKKESQHPTPETMEKRQSQIVEKQKKLAASIASSKEFGNDDDAELANFDMDAAISSHAKGTKPLTSNNQTKLATTAPKVAKPTGPPKAMRSLSSLLSGAKATQQMQTIPPKQKQPPQQKRTLSRLPRQMATSTSTDTSADSKMSKMTVSGGVTITISESEAKNISDANSKKLREEKKLCLVLDLDHTLLHATDDYRAGRFVSDEVLVENNDSEEKKGEDIKTSMTKPNPSKREDVRSILLPVELPPAQQQQYVQQKLQQQKQQDTNFCLSPLPQQKQGANSCIIMRHFIKLRPHLKEFFSQIQSTYQLSIYTAGTRSYAEQVAVMICRHLVGASYDEEGLNKLRCKVREKDEEFKKYREYKAKIGRKRQLELFWENGDFNEDDKKTETVESTRTGSVKAKSFPGSDIGGKVEETNAQSGKSSGANKPIDLTFDASNSAETRKAGATNTDGESNVAANDGECTSLSAPSSKQRRKHAGDHIIPRKRKRVNFGSLLPSAPPVIESVKKSEKHQENPPSNEEEHMDDPSEERDQLRKELQEAEKLEIAAVELRRKVFGSRIVSRTDVGDLGKDVKSLKRVFPCGGVLAAILDDREDVWANAKNNVTGRPGEPPDNLLLVKPYHWKPFIGYADVNNASGQDLSSSDDSQRVPSDKLNGAEDDAQLLWTADILRRLHERYYSTSLSPKEREGISVPSLLQTMRRETFLRHPQVKAVFSGLIPINKQNRQPQIRPHVVRYAEELGAEVLSDVSSEVTHVVAARDGSVKIRQARKEVPGCFIVHTSWLMECYWSINRRDVRPHHMGPMPSQHVKHRGLDIKTGTHSRVGHSKEDTMLLLGDNEEDSEEDESEDDDDFAADMEKEMMMQKK